MNVFHKAARLLERKGWTRGDYETKDGRLCLMGALGRAEVGYTKHSAITGKRERILCGWAGGPRNSKLLAVLAEVINEQHPGWPTILSFNDKSPDCDQDEAIRLLEKAGAKWDETH